MPGGTVEHPTSPPQHAVDCGMAFGQHAGPPATSRQVNELLALLQAAGHVDFRDARGPMGFTQRQAAGKFTRDEAERLIDRLQVASDEGGGLAGRTQNTRVERRVVASGHALRAARR